MKISRQEDYAIAFIVALLKNNGERHYVKLAKIAQQYHLPEAFLRKIASALTKAGIVTVKEGRTGGYRLTGQARQLSLGKILEVFSPELVTTGCTDKKHAKTCSLYAVCPSRLIWQSLAKNLSRNFNQIKFKKIISV
jgi:Rrf2 family protein